MTDPCDWDLDLDDCCSPPEDDTLFEKAISRASTMMLRLSGYRIGQCASSIRPLSACKECRTHCCGGADGLRLMGPDGRPITAVDKVWLGADEYPSSG